MCVAAAQNILQHTCRLTVCAGCFFYFTHIVTTAAAASTTAIHDIMMPALRFLRLTNSDAAHISTANNANIIFKSVFIVFCLFRLQK